MELFCNRPHLDFHNRALLPRDRPLVPGKCLPAPGLHLPFVENVGPTQRLWISVLEPERRDRETALDEIKRSLELSDYVPLDYVVMHLGNPKEKFTPLSFEYAYAAIAQIRSFAGVEILLENIPNEISTLERIEEFKRLSEVPEVGTAMTPATVIFKARRPPLRTFAARTSMTTTAKKMNISGRSKEPWTGRLSLKNSCWQTTKARSMFEARGEELSKGHDVMSRLEELWHEAENSIEEYRLKYRRGD